MKSVQHVAMLIVLAAVGCTDGDADDTSGGAADPTAVEQAIEALGGAEALEALDVLRIEASGTRRIDYEGLNPTEIVDVSTYSNVYWHDLSDAALRVDASRTPLFEAFQFFPADDYSVVLNGDIGDLPSQAGFFPPGPIPSGNVGALKRQQRLFNPHFILRDVLAGTIASSQLDDVDLEGRSHRVVAVGEGAEQIRLYIDAESGVLSRRPNSPAHGSEIVAMVEADHPGVAITHVIQSHHHQDHSAGLRSIAAAGATVVAGHGSRAFLETALAAPSTLRPDALSTAGVNTTVEEIAEDGTLVLGDNNITVTAHHVPSNPHAEDMVVTVIEADGQMWVYEADLYNAGTGFTLVVGGPESLFAILRDLELIDASCDAPVPLTIVPSHGVPLALADAVAELEGLGNDVGCAP